MLIWRFNSFHLLFRGFSKLKWPNFDARLVVYRGREFNQARGERNPATKYTTNVDFEKPTSSHHYRTEFVGIFVTISSLNNLFMLFVTQVKSISFNGKRQL